MSARSSKRSLGFESLETRTSLTAATSGLDLADDIMIEVAQAQAHANQQILRYIAGLREISVERSIPTEEEAIMADHWLAAESPDAIHGTNHDN